MNWMMKMVPMLAVAAALGTISAVAEAPPQGQTAPKSAGMDMKDMKGEIEQMGLQMVQIQTLMKVNMAKMEAADAAMKSHMEAEKDKMQSDMELQHAMIQHLQTMTDHMQAMAAHMSAMPAMGTHK